MAETYKIGEAAALLNLKTYVLRFWETEFPEIIPLRTEKGQRLYTKEHLALLEHIRYLLHVRGLTIGGARKVLAEERERGVDYSAALGAEENFAAAPALKGAQEAREAYAKVRALEEYESRAWQAGEADGTPAFSQYNLPGIARACSQCADDPEDLDSLSFAQYPYEDVMREQSELSSGRQRMLPLFSSARGGAPGKDASGPEAQKTSGAANEEHQKNFMVKGGGNFIHAGGADHGASMQQIEKQLADALRDNELTRERLSAHEQCSQDLLREISMELQAIANLLRAL